MPPGGPGLVSAGPSFCGTLEFLEVPGAAWSSLRLSSAVALSHCRRSPPGFRQFVFVNGVAP